MKSANDFNFVISGPRGQFNAGLWTMTKVVINVIKIGMLGVYMLKLCHRTWFYQILHSTCCLYMVWYFFSPWKSLMLVWSLIVSCERNLQDEPSHSCHSQSFFKHVQNFQKEVDLNSWGECSWTCLFMTVEAGEGLHSA